VPENVKILGEVWMTLPGVEEFRPRAIIDVEVLIETNKSIT